jgi:chemotaxis protein MotA
MQQFSGSRVQSRSFAAIIAVSCVFLLVLHSVGPDSRRLWVFFNLEGLLIVIGGVIVAAFMSFHAEDVRKALFAIMQVLRKPQMTDGSLHRDVTEIIKCARIIRGKGMRDLESRIGEIGEGDPFVKYGLNMVVSQYEPEDLRSMMSTAADAHYERDCIPLDVLQAMTSHAPAFGMVGTLVGMVTMLYNLNGNVSSIGSSLAVSFLSTLYGVLSARMLYMPAASKLRQAIDSRRFRNYLVTEGLVMLASKRTPMYIKDHLNSFMRPEAYDYFNANANNSRLSLTSNHPGINAAISSRPRLRAVGT